MSEGERQEPRQEERLFRLTDATNPPRCAFCGREQRQVAKMIAGNGVYICSDCVALCFGIIQIESPSLGTFRLAARRQDGSTGQAELEQAPFSVDERSTFQQCRHCGTWLVGYGITECLHCGERTG